jgi:hypothetical protein
MEANDLQEFRPTGLKTDGVAKSGLSNDGHAGWGVSSTSKWVGGEPGLRDLYSSNKTIRFYL